MSSRTTVYPVRFFVGTVVLAVAAFCAAGPEAEKPSASTQPGKKQLTDARVVFGRIFGDVGLTPERKQQIEKLVADLGNDDWKVREKATEELSKVGSEAVPLIDEATRSKDPEVVIRAGIILKILHDKIEYVGIELNPAIDVLFSAKDRKLIPMLIRLLSHSKRSVRHAAEYGLRRITGREFGYNSCDEPSKRALAIKKWQQWWKKNEATFAFKKPEQSKKSAGLLICDQAAKTLTAVTLDGKVAWSRKFDHQLRCAIGLTNGNVIVSFSGVQKSVVEYDRSGKEIWCLDKADLYGGWLVDVQRLPNGNTLTAQAGHGGKNAHVTEVNKDGKVVWQLKLDQPCSAQRLPNGNTLISEYRLRKVFEVDPNLKVVWEKRGLNRPSEAIRLPNGNTLIVESGKQRVIEVNRAGQIVWERKCPARPSSACRLPNGTTVINNPTEGAVIVGRDGKVIRTLLKHSGKFGTIRLVPEAVLKSSPNHKPADPA